MDKVRKALKGLADILVTAEREDSMYGNAARLIKEKFIVIGFDFYGGMDRDLITTAGMQFVLPALAERTLAVRSYSTG